MRLFHFTAASYAVQAIQKQRLKAATIGALNDPFELLSCDLPDIHARHAFSSFKLWASGKYAMLCFTKSWRNPLHWSHYADRHKGVALEFDIDDAVVSKVRYVRQRDPFDYAAIAAAGGFSLEQAGRVFNTKAHYWGYEREYRVALGLNECKQDSGLYFYPFDAQIKLRGLVLGALCQLTAEDIQEALPRGTSLYVRKARLAFRSFAIVRQRTYEVRHVQSAA